MTLTADGAHVAVVSRHASRVSLCVFDDSGDTERVRLVLPQRLGDLHYGFVEGLKEGARYGLRAEGPWDPAQGHRFDPSKLLVDPYGLRIDRPYRQHPDLTMRGTDTATRVPKSVLERLPADARPLPPHRPQLIYEVPVRAFTRRHPAVPPEKRGTVAALAEPAIIEHLKTLGVDTLELMPLAAWIDERHLPPLGLTNAWGYNPVAFMAPDPRLAPGGLAEIRATVDTLHAHGIRVILDVVVNHTGESDVLGATLSLRGLDNALYYLHADGQLVNHTGCGNTLALDRAPVVQMVMDALRSWVMHTGIDGFRFDLATVMGRTRDGFSTDSALLAAIAQDPLLGSLILVAEPWDIGPGGYQLGRFPAAWQEWNDRFRDDVRRFWRGDAGSAGELATRIAGSSDLFAPHRRPSSGINFVAAHDGFTLRDSVTYLLKNNHANGEGNRDGNDHEPTWPGGDVKALLATLFLSRGTPMLTAGDEFGRSQRGNNNAYAQDNETTWLDWAAADRDLIAFTAALSALRRSLPLVTEDAFLTGLPRNGSAGPDAQWLSADGSPMNWHDRDAAVLGLVLAGGAERIALWFNRGPQAVSPVMPRRAGCAWRRIFCSADGDGVPARAVAVYLEEQRAGRGVSDEELAALAREAGVSTEWWEVDGTHHQVTPETLRVILEALRLPHAGADDLVESRRRLAAARLPLLGKAGHPVRLAEPSGHRRRFMLEGEGISRFIDADPDMVPVATLPAGFYTCRDASTPDESWPLLVSPGTCHLPEEIRDGRRVFGLTAHLYALRHAGDGGIGDFETLQRLAGITREIGGRYAGLNPLHHLFPADRSRVSPYQPSDRRYIDPIYINIESLVKQFPVPQATALAARSRAAFAELETLRHVDYPAVWKAKEAILRAVFAGFEPSPDYSAFVAAGGEDLARHGRFEAARAGEAITPEAIAWRAFLQWIAEKQLARAAVHRNLYRDLALGCAFDGGEIADGGEHFAPGVSLGAPPDPFSSAGQTWNLPPFSPLALTASGFSPLRTVLAANMRHAAALRIDHILGFARQFWVPKGAEGRLGTYVRFPLDHLVAVTAIESRRHCCLIVGEDLGTVPDGLREAMAEAAIFSCRVLWFERDGNGFRPPEHYPARALACLASHDLPTFRGWRMGRDIEIDRDLGRLTDDEVKARRASRKAEVAMLDRLAGATAGDADAAVHGLLARTPSQIMLIQADDLTAESEPLNVPGTDRERPNWRRRLAATVEDLPSLPLARAIIERVKRERPPP